MHKKTTKFFPLLNAPALFWSAPQQVVRFEDGYARFSVFKKKGGRWILLEDQTFEATEVASKIKRVKNAHLCFLPEELIQKEITLSSQIKSQGTIEKILSLKLKSQMQEEVVFGISSTSLQPTSQQKEFRVVGIKKSEIEGLLKRLPKRSSVRTITADYFALFAISREAAAKKGFIAFHVQKEKVLMVCGNDKELLLWRLGITFSADQSDRRTTLADEMARSAFYAMQLYRAQSFEILLVSGDVVEDDLLFLRLQERINIPISAPNPFFFAAGLHPALFYELLVSLGSLETLENHNFLPLSFKSEREFIVATNVLALLLILPLFYFGYKNALGIVELKESLGELEAQKNSFFEVQRGIVPIEQERLTYLKNYFVLQNRMFKADVSNDLYLLKPFFDLLSPNSLEVEVKENQTQIQVHFLRSFDKLEELVEFEKRFQAVANEFKKSHPIDIASAVDYQKLEFKADIKLASSK